MAAIAPPSHKHLHRHNTNMGIRDRVSRLKEKLDFGSTGRRRKPDGAGSGTDEERVHPVGSLPRPIPSVIAGGHDGGGGGSNPNTDQHLVRLRDRLSRPDTPDSAPGEQRGRVGADEGEASQSQSHLRGLGAAVGSDPVREGDCGDGEKVKQVYTPLSTSSILDNDESEGK